MPPTQTPSPPSSPAGTEAAARELHHLLRSRDLRPAIAYFRSLPSPFDLLPNHALNAFLRALAAAGRIRAAADVFRRVPSPTSHSYNSLLVALLRRGRRRAAAAALAALLRSATAAPDAATLNALLSFSDFSDSGRLTRIFRSLPKQYGFRPDAISYNSLLYSLCRAGDLRAARELLDEMRVSGQVGGGSAAHMLDEMPVRKRTVSGVTQEVGQPIDEMCVRNLNGSDDASLVAGHPTNKMHAMKQNGGDTFPNVITYTTMIRGYCAKHLTDEALSVLRVMVADGVEPNRITYNTLVQGFCEAGRMRLVKEVLEMGSFRPDTCTFNTLIAVHCRMGQVSDAMEVFNRMAELRVRRDSASYSTVIRALCEKGEFGRAEELVDELLEKEVLKKRGGSVPVIAAYNPIFVHLCENGKAKKARMVFGQLLDRKSRMDAAAFKTLILGHCREGDFEEGYQLVMSMLKRDLVPDAESYLAVIDGFLQRGKMKVAWETLHRMLNSGHRPSTSTFHSVLKGLLMKDDCAKEAGDLIKVMLERKIRQNINLSTNLIDALFKSGLNDHAHKIVISLYDNGYYIKMEKLIGSLCQESRFVEAMELALFSLGKQQHFSPAVSNVLLDGLCMTGRTAEAFRLFYELVDIRSAASAASPRSLVALHHALEEAGRMKEADFVAKQMRRAHARTTQGF